MQKEGESANKKKCWLPTKLWNSFNIFIDLLFLLSSDLLQDGCKIANVLSKK